MKRLRAIHAGSDHNLARIWDDWISSIALAIANGCDRRAAVWRSREDEYMQIVERHGRETMVAFSEMLVLVVQALECDLPMDLLGSIYMALELGNDHAGQFFTPSSVCELMAAMTLQPDYLREMVERDGFIAVQEPAIGGGAMVIPVIRAVREAGLNPSQHMHVTGVDIDWTVLRMAYVQLSLLGVPAVLYVGDTLRMEMREDWYTPVHVLEGWGRRLRAGRDTSVEIESAVELARSAVAELEHPTSTSSEPVQLSLLG